MSGVTEITSLYSRTIGAVMVATHASTAAASWDLWSASLAIVFSPKTPVFFETPRGKQNQTPPGTVADGPDAGRAGPP